jgi:hypothetical protein
LRTSFGVIGIFLALAFAGLGWWLHDRYGAAIHYSGIGRPYPIGNSVLAFLGIAVAMLGLITAMILAMLTFF